jgi:hypothetical protein
MRKVLLLLIIIISILACNDEPKEAMQTPESFRHFITKFKLLSFPIILRPHTETFELNTFDDKSEDTLYVKDFTQLYGMLPDTNNYYALITMVPADDLVPVLTTYSKDGKIIGSTCLIVNGCGGGPGLDYCSSTGMISKNLSIYCADTLKTVEVDSTNEPIPNTSQYYRTFFEGQINSKGEINMTEAKTAEIK